MIGWLGDKSSPKNQKKHHPTHLLDAFQCFSECFTQGPHRWLQLEVLHLSVERPQRRSRALKGSGASDETLWDLLRKLMSTSSMVHHSQELLRKKISGNTWIHLDLLEVWNG